MITLGRAFLRQAIDDAFLRLLRAKAAAAIAAGDRERFRLDVEELWEARRLAARAIDTDLAE